MEGGRLRGGKGEGVEGRRLERERRKLMNGREKYNVRFPSLLFCRKRLMITWRRKERGRFWSALTNWRWPMPDLTM